jgi:hypothetical protein
MTTIKKPPRLTEQAMAGTGGVYLESAEADVIVMVYQCHDRDAEHNDEVGNGDYRKCHANDSNY